MDNLLSKIDNWSKDFLSSTVNIEDGAGVRSHLWLQGVSSEYYVKSDDAEANEIDPLFDHDEAFPLTQSAPGEELILDLGFPNSLMKATCRGEFYDGADRIFCNDNTFFNFMASGYETYWLSVNMCDWMGKQYPSCLGDLTKSGDEARLHMLKTSHAPSRQVAAEDQGEDSDSTYSSQKAALGKVPERNFLATFGNPCESEAKTQASKKCRSTSSCTYVSS